MSKTVNTLNIGDKLFNPRIEEIREYEITEIQKSTQGIKVGTKAYEYRLSDADYNSAISPIVFFYKRSDKLYIRIEDALSEQKRLQTVELKRIQTGVENALKKLNEFTLKYFTDASKNP